MEYIYDYNMNIRKFLMCALAGAPLLSFAAVPSKHGIETGFLYVCLRRVEKE